MIFDARVIGLPNYLDLVRQQLGKDDGSHQSRKFDRIKKAIQQGNKGIADEVAGVFKRKAEPVSHVYFERYGLLGPFQTWACARDGTTMQMVAKENTWTDYLHTVMLGSNDGMILPLDFAVPFAVDIEDQSYPYPVCSAQRVQREVELANKTLRVEKAFHMPRIPDFINARRQETKKLEKSADLDEAFWAKFGLVVLRHLVQKSLEHKLPVVLGVRALEPAV